MGEAEMTVRCNGWIPSLRGEKVLFTGKTLVDGEWMVRADCRKRITTKGAAALVNVSRQITLLVHGELAGNVKDPDRGLSQKLLKILDMRRNGHHVHVVDAAGFSDLLFGGVARCRVLRAESGGVLVDPYPGDGALGGPFERLALRTRTASGWARDVLGRGTRAHSELIGDLEAHVRRQGMDPREPNRRGPQFDLGWVRDNVVYGAWVLGDGPTEPERVDRALRDIGPRVARPTSRGETYRSVLVVPGAPAVAVSRSASTVTWAPGFPGI
ncbi:hypothetical protein OG216_16555 [Streptomycetaceae bacterium NBC_01309]